MLRRQYWGGQLNGKRYKRLFGVFRWAADLAHAFSNKQTAEELQQQMVDDTAERNHLSDEEIEAFLYENYEDKKSTELLLTVQY